MGPWLVEVQSRGDLDVWLGDEPPTSYRPVVMVVRGDGELVREFLPNALDAAKLEDRRVVVWVRDEGMLTAEELEDMFKADPEILAVALSIDHRVGGWVYRAGIDVDDASFAFRQAEN